MIPPGDDESERKASASRLSVGQLMTVVAWAALTLFPVAQLARRVDPAMLQWAVYFEMTAPPTLAYFWLRSQARDPARRRQVRRWYWAVLPIYYLLAVGAVYAAMLRR